MSKRRIEVFTAGCYLCDSVVKEIKALACSNCEVIVYDLNNKCNSNECENKVKQYGIQSIPAVAINGKLVDCCQGKGVDIEKLKAAGLGQ
ncbi:hypothetical protein CathTA2_0097 [Caldalkalibacillus thermarum TA2.A1]|uniref:Thioredoxin family protein n=2 Tax=Caldalkalibacillus TaxID=379065 RepID=F5LBA9_CALTT|nr:MULTISPECIES: thioredoxin family protein [Caldalkalibacillus]EGL81373.1 hypothetical protein CathTA2_0097 [Caldalkalibacillus thermarum TA2.A1]MDQ0339063.1 glutaredoxin [Caldalkalibacillus uzonensis]QZT33234.1 thioredoxin family protein [Caldalkalibacillus thermarum TA2.A1]